LSKSRDIPREGLIKWLADPFFHNKNSNSIIFKIHKWLADPFALVLISPPLALSTKTGSFLAL
jgi:hypothetical protein